MTGPVGGSLHPPAENRPEVTSYRIAHLSDPHLSRQFYREHIKSFKILLRSIVDESYDHIVISGDIVSTADPEDFYLARAIFQTFGLLNSSRLTVVPGNHDVFGGPHRATDVLSFPSHIRSVDYQYRQRLFYQAFAETFVGSTRLVPSAPYPFLKRTGPFVLFGLNSIPPWSFGENLLGTNGKLCADQMSSLETLCDGSLTRMGIPVVVMHHHMNDLADDATSTGLWKRVESQTMRMRKRRKLKRQFSQIGVQYVLHGHIHRNAIYQEQDIVYMNGAGAVCDDPDAILKFNSLVWRDGECDARTNRLPTAFQPSVLSLPLHRFGRRLSAPALNAW